MLSGIFIVVGIVFIFIGLHFAKSLMNLLNNYYNYLDKKIQLFIVVGLASFLAMRFFSTGVILILAVFKNILFKHLS